MSQTSLRIQGLVKASRNIRQMLQVGLQPDALDTFRREVQALIQRVDEICEQHGATPEDLPTPSRNAYRSLLHIDLDQLPVRDHKEPAPPKKIQVANVVKTGTRLLEHIWLHRESLFDSEGRQRTFLQQIERHCQTIESICEKHQGSTALLERPTQQVYCWMKFLLQPGRFEDHLEALMCAELEARPFLDELGASRQGPTGLEIHMSHTGALWRLKPQKGRFLLKCSEGFLYAPTEVWQAMFGSMFKRRTPQRKATVAEFLESETYTSVLFELQSVIELPEVSTKGVAHDLLECFERVNALYFEPPLSPPRIHWSQTPTTSKYGHYQSTTDTVMLSSTLDREEVPEFVVDFVMYHELLHKKHGAQIVNGRRMVHTPAFREDERRFEGYEEAESFLLEWAMRLHEGS